MHQTPSLGELTPSPPGIGRAAPLPRGGRSTAGQWSARSPPRQALSRTLGNTPRCDPHVHKCSGTQRRTPDQTFRHFRTSSALHQHPEHPDQPRARPDRAAIGPGCEASAELRQLYTSRQVVFAESQTPSPRTHRKRLSEPHLHRYRQHSVNPRNNSYPNLFRAIRPVQPLLKLVQP